MLSGGKKREHGPEMNLAVFLNVYLMTKLCPTFFILFTAPQKMSHKAFMKAFKRSIRIFIQNPKVVSILDVWEGSECASGVYHISDNGKVV